MRFALGLLVPGLILASGCFKPLNLEKYPVPPHTLVIDFGSPVKYVMELKIDGEVIPIRYASKNRRLIVEGLETGKHFFNINSISYVFGPEFEEFHVDPQGGAYFFIQSRKYRSALPKNKAQVSIRAYRKQLRRDGIDVNSVPSHKVRAYFQTRGEREKLWGQPLQDQDKQDGDSESGASD